jgi:serine/threonine-protein kinase RsbT
MLGSCAATKVTGGRSHVGEAVKVNGTAIAREVRVAIDSEVDILAARSKGRALAAELEFAPADLVVIATAISELARNIVAYANSGEILLQAVDDHDGRTGLMVKARDEGPGIRDLPRVLHNGYSTAGSLALGLAGVRRVMDEFEIESDPGRGTTVSATKWRRPTNGAERRHL